MHNSSTTTRLVVFALCGLAVVQATAIGRRDVEGKDTVEGASNGMTIKTGYGGYLHADSRGALAETRKDAWLPASQLDLFKALIMYQSSFLPAIGVKIAKIFLQFVLALFVGVAATTAMCSFTPLCHISLNASKPSFFADKDLLPAMKEAFEAVSRIPNFFKKDQPPAQVQPEQPLEVSTDALEESQQLDPRVPRKNLDDASRSLKSKPSDVKESEN